MDDAIMKRFISDYHSLQILKAHGYIIDEETFCKIERVMLLEIIEEMKRCVDNQEKKPK